MANNDRDVNLSIRAKDLSSGTVNEISQAVRNLSGNLKDLTAAAVRGEAASSDLARAQKELADAGRGLQKISTTINKYEELSASLVEAKAKLEALSATQAKAAAATEGGAKATKKQQQELAAANRDVERQKAKIDALEQATAKLNATLTKAGVDTANTSAAMAQMTATAQQGQIAIQALANTQAGLAKSTREYAEAQKAAQAATNRQKEIKEAEDAARAYTRLADASARVAEARVRRPGDTMLATGAQFAAPRDLASVETRASASAAQAANAISTRSPVADYLPQLQELERLMRRTEQIAGKVDGYKAQAEAVRAAARTLREKNQEHIAAVSAEGANSAATRRAADAQRNARQQYQEAVTRLKVLKDELNDAGIRTRDLTAAQTRLIDTSKQLRDATANLNTAFAQFGGARTGAPGVLGLRPYEITNLSFQVNDFFTQLASGTSVMQAFMQQIGQVVQIAPIGNALRAAAFPVLALATAFGVLTAALVRYADQQSIVREATARRTLIGATDANPDPRAVQQATDAARRAGGAWDESRQAAMRFMNLPVQLTTQQYQQLTVATMNMAQVNGEAAQTIDRVATALNGSNDEFRKFFTEVVRISPELVRAYTEAQTAEERTAALGRVVAEFATQAQRARNDGTNPLKDSILALRNAWQDLLESLNNAGLADVGVAALNRLKIVVDGLANSMRILGSLPTFGLIVGGAVGGTMVGGPLGGLAGGIGGAWVASELGNRANQNNPLVRGPRPGDVPSGTIPDISVTAAAPLETAQQIALRQQAEAMLNLQRQQAEEERAIARAVERRATAAQRAAGFAAAEAQARREFLNANPSLRNNQSPEARALIDAAGAEGRRQLQFRIDQANTPEAAAADMRRDFEMINREIQSVLSMRTDAYRVIQEEMASGAISGAEGVRRLQRAAAEARPDLERLVAEAREFNRLNPDPNVIGAATRRATISRAERNLSDDGMRTQIREAASRESQSVSQMFQERGTMVQTINQLREAGGITSAEAQQRIRNAYAESNLQLSEAIDRLQEFNNAARETNAIAPAAFELTNARIQLFRQQLTYVDPEMTRLRESFTNTFGQGAVQMFSGVADAIGGVITGSQRLGSVWAALRNGFLSMISSVLRGLAETILKTQMLAVAQQALNWLGLSGGGGKSGASSGGSGLNIGSLITSAIGAIGGWFGGAPIMENTAGGGMLKFHSGGVVGLDGTPVKGNPYWFANAPRYHSGGMVGLAPDEQAAILQTGEEVLSRNDPRNIMNGLKTGGSGGASSIKQVLVLNEDEMRQAMASKAGEQIVITHLKRNVGTVRSILA